MSAPQDPLRKASRDLLMQYIVDSLKAEEATRAGNQRTIYGQAAFVAGWMEAAPPNILAALPRQDEPGLREALWQCGVESGMDTDGDTGPGAIVAGMGDAGFAAAIVEHVRQLRGAYDECLAEPGLDAAWAHLREYTEQLAKAMSTAYKSVGSWDDFDDTVLAFAEATVREYVALASEEGAAPPGDDDAE